MIRLLHDDVLVVHEWQRFALLFLRLLRFGRYRLLWALLLCCPILQLIRLVLLVNTLIEEEVGVCTALPLDEVHSS